jgi:aminoglycoside 6'-N-acetyltransferase I
MRADLLPAESVAHEPEVDAYFAGMLDLAAVFVAERFPGSLAGFIEVAARDWAEGCDSSPVAYIEAWYVDPDVRRRGIGRELFAAAEEWARSAGFREIGSDAEVTNTASIRAHLALGYEEMLRLVCFRRRLDGEEEHAPSWLTGGA